MTLRPMEMSDADFMLELKNDPATRKFAILTDQEIKREDHIKFLEQHLSEFQVIELFQGTERAGAVRIKDNEISIWISKDVRRSTLATQALLLCRKLRMTAKIVIGNIASIRAFINAGFKPEELVDNKYYIFRYVA